MEIIKLSDNVQMILKKL